MNKDSVHYHLENMLKTYIDDEIYYVIIDYVLGRERGWFIKTLVADLRDENFDKYLELMEDLKKLGKETDKFGEYEGLYED